MASKATHEHRGPHALNRLNSVYKKVSACLDTVQDELTHDCSETREQVCLIILEDDLVNLLEECENHLLGQQRPRRVELHSLESRTQCVIEELLKFLGRSSLSPSKVTHH